MTLALVGCVTVGLMSTVNFIPDPDKHYRQISAILFAPPQRRLSDKLVPASTGSKVPASAKATAAAISAATADSMPSRSTG